MGQLPKKLSTRPAGVLTNVILIISNPNKRKCWGMFNLYVAQLYIVHFWANEILIYPVSLYDTYFLTPYKLKQSECSITKLLT